MHAKIQRVYQCALHDEYRDMTAERDQHTTFMAETRHCRSAQLSALPTDVQQCVLFCKAKLTDDSSAVFSLPRAAFELMSGAAAEIVLPLGSHAFPCEHPLRTGAREKQIEDMYMYTYICTTNI